jgi:putative glutamine amidotransferase
LRDRLVVCCESQRKAEPYLKSLLLMGIDAEKIHLATPEEPDQNLSSVAAEAAGVVLCGGPDLDPRWYGELARSDAKLSILPDLDQMDWTLLEGTREGRTPVWAICRGMQTFNVFQGGTLWQDLPSQVQGVLEHQPEGPDDSMAHPIRLLARQETFAEILGVETTEVNSRHHQAVRTLGRQIIRVAESPDGVLEVLALDRQDWWVKGVQWHPENLMHLQVQRRLWSEFLDAADAKAHNSGTGPLRN